MNEPGTEEVQFLERIAINFLTNLNEPGTEEGEFLRLNRPWKIDRSQRHEDATHEIEVC